MTNEAKEAAERLLDLHAVMALGDWQVIDPPGAQIRDETGVVARVLARKMTAARFCVAAHNDAPAICTALLTALTDNDKLRERVRVLEEALSPVAGWLEYAYGHVSSVTSEKVKAHLPALRALKKEGSQS